MRINDKIAELELQVEPLREQAEKAKKYLVLRDELRVLEISVWLENLDTPEGGRPASWRRTFDAAESQRDEARAALDAALCRRGSGTAEQMREKDMEAERVRARESAALEEQIKEKESAVAVLESTVTHNRENIQRAEAELAAGGEPFRRPCESQAEEQEARVAEIDRRIGELNGALAALLETAQDHGGTGRRRPERGGAPAGTGGPRAWPPPRTRGPELAAAAAEKKRIQERRDGRRARQGRRGGAACSPPGRRRGRTAAPWRMPGTRRRPPPTSSAGHSLRMEERKKKAAAGRGAAGPADRWTRGRWKTAAAC